MPRRTPALPTARSAALLVAVLLAASLAPRLASAQRPGYQINHWEDTPVGDHFLSVDHPWYSSTRYFAAGLTFDFNNGLFRTCGAGSGCPSSVAVLENQLQGHLDLAGSFLDRIAITASLPLVLWESGGSSTITPDVRYLTVPGLGDPRVGLRVRLFGQPETGPVSLSVGGNLWIPIGMARNHTGDNNVRGEGKVMLGGVVADHFRYTVNAGFYYRDVAQLSNTVGTGDGNTVGMEVQTGLGLQATFLNRSLSFGPEGLLNIPVASGLPRSRQTAVHSSIFGTVSYLIAETVMLQLSVGGRVYGSPSLPDIQGILRIAYAPRTPAEKPRPVVKSDRDKDGIFDDADACPDEFGPASTDAKKHGCPPPSDRDKDGVLDGKDECADEPKGDHPDPGHPGCPAKDSDGDGVYDFEDKCAAEPAGAEPDPERAGCPDRDTDGDGLVDHKDQCPGEPIGLIADAARPGCPAPDKDVDQIPDDKDACPDKPGAPNPDPKLNGCPGKVQIKDNQILILEQVFFDTGKNTIQKRSFPLLDSVAYVLDVTPAIKSVGVEGHTDNKGNPKKNLDLSQKRADAVVKYLVGKKIDEKRMKSFGFGDTRPVADNKTNEGRSQNRRVVFQILDPAPPKK